MAQNSSTGKQATSKSSREIYQRIARGLRRGLIASVKQRYAGNGVVRVGNALTGLLTQSLSRDG